MCVCVSLSLSKRSANLLTDEQILRILTNLQLKMATI